MYTNEDKTPRNSTGRIDYWQRGAHRYKIRAVHKKVENQPM
jgi:hypothetical protein